MYPLAHWRQHIDFERFESGLLTASREAFLAVQRDHPDETFYAFALYKSPLLEYVLPTSNSEEGLAKAIDKHRHDYAARGWKFDESRMLLSLRWEFPATWFYYSYGQEAFDPVNNQLLETGYLGHVFKEDDLLQLLKYADEIMCRVLTQLDSEGLFGTGVQRNRVVLCIKMGDDVPRFENVQRLNPPDAYAWYKSDIDELYRPRQSFLSRLTHRT